MLLFMRWMVLVASTYLKWERVLDKWSDPPQLSNSLSTIITALRALPLTCAGLISLVDPPRDGVDDAVARCRAGGIRVTMVTGE